MAKEEKVQSSGSSGGSSGSSSNGSAGKASGGSSSKSFTGGSSGASSKASPSTKARIGSRDSSAHAAASADRAAAASRGKVTKFIPSTRGGTGTTNRGNVGSSTAANNMGGQGVKNRYQWNQGFESQHHFGGTEDFDKMAANLSVPTDYEDRNFHFFIPNGNASKDFLTEASEKNIDRSLWSASEVYKDLDREYKSPEERRENLRDWMYHAQVYYKHALDNNYTFTDNDGNEVKVADVWKDIYDQLAYDDEFGSYINGGPDPWSAGLTQNKIKQAQANYDAAQTDEERERWQLTIQDLSNTDYRAISNNYKQAYDMYMSGGEVDLDGLRANAQALDYHAQLYGDSEEANDFIALRNAVNGLADSVEKDINRSHYEEAQKQLEQLKTENKAIKASGAGLSDYDEGYDEFLRQNALNEKQQAELEQQMAGLNDELFEKFASDPVKEARYRLEHPREYEKYKHEHGLMLKQEQELHEQDQAMVDQFMASIGVAPQYYNFVDRATGAVHSGAYGIAGSAVDLASLVGRTARDLDAYGDANPDGEVDFFAWDKAQTERRNQTKELMAAYDMAHGENAYAKDFGHFLDVQDAMTANSELEARREELLGTVGDDGVVSDELSRELDAIDKKLKENKKQIKEWQKEDALNGISDETVLGKFTELGNYLDYREGAELSKAIQGANTATKYFMMGTKNALEMGFDTGVALMTAGGSQVASLSSLFLRILGKSTAEVNRAGGSLTEQWLYGAGTAGLEVGTELIGGTFDKIGYSRGLTSNLGEKVVALMADTPKGRMAVRLVENACEEMGEEWVSNKLSPYLDLIYRDESLKELKEEEYAETATDCILGFFMGFAYSTVNVVDGSAAGFNYESYQADLQSDAKKTHDLLKQQQAEAKANAAPKSSTAFRVIDNGSTQSPIQNQRINSMLQNPREVNWFERQTGQTIEGNTTPEKRQSVYNILQQYEAHQNETPQLANPTVATRVVQKAEQMANYDGQNLPEEIRYTPTEYKVAEAMGLADPEIAPAVVQTGMSPEEVAKTRGQQQQGYIARLEQSPFWQKIRANTQNIITRGKQAPATEAQPVDNSDTIEQGNVPSTEEQAKTDAMAQSQKQTLEGQEKSPTPSPKKTEPPTPPETPAGGEAGSKPTGTPEGSAPAVKLEENGPENDSTPPAPAEPKKTTPKTPKKTEAEREAERLANQEAHRKNQEENAIRKKADDAAIEKAWENRDYIDGSAVVTFEGQKNGKPVTVTYDASTETFTYTYQDGKVDTLTKVKRIQAKKLVTDVRSTLIDRKGYKGKSSWKPSTGKTGKAAPEPQAEPATQPQAVSEPESADERSFQEVAEVGVDTIYERYSKDPEVFRQEYEEATGEELDEDDLDSAFEELYNRAKAGELYQAEETESEEAEGEEAPAEETPEVEAAPEEKEAESEETEGEEKPEAAEETESEEAEEEKAPETPTGPIKDRLLKGEVSDTEVTTRLGSPATRTELKQALGLPSNTSEAKVRDAVKIAALDHDQVVDDLKNGRFTASNIQTLVRTGKVTAEELSGILRDAGIIGKKNVTGLPTLEKRYIQLQAKVNPEALTDADRAKLATQEKHDITVKKTNAETAQDLAELTQARLDQKGDDTSASALYNEFTDEDRIAFKQAGADLITKNGLTAAEITDLITKDSDALKEYAAKTGHNPDQVRLALIEGYNQLTHDDIGLYGAKFAVKKVEEAIQKYRGTDFTVANYKAKTSATENVKTTKEDQNVTREQPGDLDGRVATTKRGVEEAFGRILGDPAWAKSFGGSGLGDAETASHYWEKETSAYTKVGGQVLPFQKLTPTVKKAVQRLLSGVNEDQASRIPLVTVIDASNISEKDFNNVMGFVSEEGSGLGIWLVVNPPIRGKTAPGVVLLHEPVHYFMAKWREEQMGPEGKSYKEPMGLNFVGSFVQRFNKANGISIVGTKEQQLRSIVKSAQSIISRELQAYGRGLLTEYGIEYEDDEWDAFKSKSAAEQFAEVKTEFKEIGEDYDDFFTRLVEELTANIAAGNEVLNDGVFNVSDYKQAMRDLLYDSGYVPVGFFENLDSVSAAWTKEFGKKPKGKLGGGKKTSKAKTLSDVSPEMEELQALSHEPTEVERLASRQYGFVDEYNKIEKFLAKLEGRKPQLIQGPDANVPHLEDYYILPDGEKDGARTNTPVSEKILPEERAKAGEIRYKKTSLREIGEAAHETIQRILNEEQLGFNELTKQLLAKNPAAMTTLEQQMVNELYRRVQTQRHNLLHRKGTVHDSLIPSDPAVLWQIEQRLREVSSESAGEGARKVTQQRFSMTPEQEVWNNLSHTYLGGADPLVEDSSSTEAKMYDLGATMLDGIADIDARREAEEIDEKTAVSEMLTMVREINKVRDVARTFGPAGQIMSKWEQACLNRIANKGGEDAYDTLRMIALGSVNRINSDFDAVGLTNTVKQIRYLNLLSNPATKVSNLINNFESSLNGAIGQNIAVKLQGERAKKIMGGDTPLTMNQNWHRGFIGKTNKALNEYMLTKGAESVLALYYGLDVDEGVIDIDLGAKHNQNSNAASRLLATFQFLSGLGMTTTDAMAIARAYRGMEMEIDQMNISNARKQQMKADAMMEARRQMYHADSKASKAMENLRDVLNGVTILGNKETGAIGLGDITMPFVQVPTNVALRAMRATPLGVTYGIAKYVQGMNRLQARRETYDRVQELMKRKEAKVALNAEEMKFLRENQGVSEPTDAEVRKLMRGLGESATNASATVLAAIATMMGALRDFDDEDDEAMKRLAQERGFTGLQLNLSNLMRLGRGGWKKDDLVIGGSWMEVLAIPMVAGQHIVKNWWEEDRTAGGLTSAIIESPLTTFQTFVDAAQEIPGIAQIADIWDAYENLQNYSVDKQKDRFLAGLSQYASNAASTFVIPNAVAQFAAGMDNKHRDVYRADTNWEIAANIWKNKLPGNFFGIGRETLPESFSSLGESRPYGKSKAAGIVNRMLLPGTGAQRWLPSKLEEKYQEFADAGLKVESVAPAKSPPSKITSLDGKEYTPNAEEARYYDETYTEDAVRLEYGLMNNPEFQNMTLNQQYEAMNKLRQFEDHIAKTEFLLSRGDDSGVQMDNWEKLYCEVDGTDVKISNYEKATQYALAYAAARSVYSSKTHTFTGDESTEWFLKNVYSKLDDAQRVAFDGSFPSMDKLYDGYTKAGITPEEYNKIRELNKEYTDKAKDKDNDISYSEAQRDLAVRYDETLGGEKAKWAIENNKIWYTLPASTTTPDKLVKSGLTIQEADEWLDRKSQIIPAEGYKEPSLNQIIQNIAGDTSLSADKQWRVLLTDGDISDSARNRLSEYKLAHPNATLLDAVNNVTYWYKDPYNKNSKWELRSYAEVYTKEAEEKSYPYAEKLSAKYGIAA